MTVNSSYRADIDGLRAISILFVLIYHGFPSFMPGGFVGVDVFFVISGYLITQLIYNQAKITNFQYMFFILDAYYVSSQLY